MKVVAVNGSNDPRANNMLGRRDLNTLWGLLRGHIPSKEAPKPLKPAIRQWRSIGFLARNTDGHLDGIDDLRNAELEIGNESRPETRTLKTQENSFFLNFTSFRPSGSTLYAFI